MLAGYYTIASGMLTRQREIDSIGNNLVNLQTPGYRADRLLVTSFDQQLLTRMEANGNEVLGGGVASTSAVVDEVVSLFNDGLIEATNRNMDMAISGPGFFNVQAADGTVYLTRNGQFDLDEEGYLTLPGYGRVRGENGLLQLGSEGFTVEPDGMIFSPDGQLLGRLLVTVPPEGTSLLKLDNGMFQFPPNVQGQLATNYSVTQGNLELANTDINRELTYLMESQRGFQSCSSALQIVDALNRKAVTIGSV